MKSKPEEVINGIRKYHKDMQWIWQTRILGTQNYMQCRFMTMENFWNDEFTTFPSDNLQLAKTEKETKE